MPRVLDVTAAADRLTLDAQRRGTALFTVTNPGAADVAGALEVVCLDGAAIATCTVQGAAERVFRPGVTTSVVCAVEVPAHVAAGTYRLRLDAKMADPALGLVRGPEIILVVPEGGGSVASDGPSRRSILIIVLIILGVLLVGGGIALAVALGGDEAEPGDARARDAAQAWLKLARAGSPEELAAFASAPHLMHDDVVVAQVLVRRYAAALARDEVKAALAAELTLGRGVPATTAPAEDQPPAAHAAALALDADDAVVVASGGEPRRPLIRIYLRRDGDRVSAAGFTVAP